MLIHENHDFAMETLPPQSFSRDGNGLISPNKLQRQSQQAYLLRRDVVKYGQIFFGKGLLRLPARDAVPYWNSRFGEVAHESQATDPPSSVSSEVDDELLAIQTLNGPIDVAGNIDADRAGEHAYLQPADAAFFDEGDGLKLNKRALLRL